MKIQSVRGTHDLYGQATLINLDKIDRTVKEVMQKFMVSMKL